MRRLRPILCLLLLAACTPDDLLRFFHGSAELPPASLTIVLVTESADPGPDLLAATAAVLQRRLDILGVPASVNVSGDNEITVASGLIDGSGGDLVPLLTRTGRVEFADLRNAPAELLANPNDALLATSAHPAAGEQLDPVTGAPYLTVLDAVAIIESGASQSQFSDTWDIRLKFSPEHGALLADYTAANIGTAMGILIDGRLLSAPIIQAQIGDEAIIAGDFDETEARQLAAIVGGGTLPIALIFAEIY